MIGTSDLSAIAQKHMAVLQQAGYRSVFDICAGGRTDFIRDMRDHLSADEARTVYRNARQRAEQLKTLYRAWQLRQEPVTGRIKKGFYAGIPDFSVTPVSARQPTHPGQ